MSQSKMYEDDLRKDVGESYANVAASGQNKVSYVGTLQRLARAFLKWDKTADKAVRRELQRYSSLSLTVENCGWTTAQSFREVFGRALVSSAQNDNAAERTEYLESESEDKTDASKKARRVAFWDALPDGVSDETIKRALGTGD